MKTIVKNLMPQIVVNIIKQIRYMLQGGKRKN